jgi:hypothetical protein
MGTIHESTFMVDSFSFKNKKGRAISGPAIITFLEYN